jgi:hypothetical protein
VTGRSRAALAAALAAVGAGCDARDAAPDTTRAATRDTAAVSCADTGTARACTVRGLFAGAPDARLVLATSGEVPDTLRITLERPGRPPLALPTFYGSRLWGQCGPAGDDDYVPRLDRLAVADVDGDGRDDLVVLGECMTGIGPTGAHPFPAGAVYLDDGRGAYRSVEPVDSALTDLAVASCPARCDVRALAREAVRRAGPR